MSPPDAPGPGFGDMPPPDMAFPRLPAPPAPVGNSVRAAAGRRRLQARFLRAGRAAVDDRELLELLLSGRRCAGDAAALAAGLLEMFGTAPRVLAARPDRLRSVPGLSGDAIAALKAAEALGIRMARAEVPDTVRPTFGNYSGRSSTIAAPSPGSARPRSSICCSWTGGTHSSPTSCTSAAPSATPRPTPARSACAAWNFRPARSSPYTTIRAVVPSRPRRTSR